MVINTVLSVMAYEYPTENLSVYLSDDGGSDITFYALLEASQFAKVWIPFCKKFKVEPRSPGAYFNEAYSGSDDSLVEWMDIKVCEFNLLPSMQKNDDLKIQILCSSKIVHIKVTVSIVPVRIC
jgi:cellulose synthase/poly-beta-1,6-N-acetylglucosamine synthase-like glycosyltransferase